MARNKLDDASLNKIFDVVADIVTHYFDIEYMHSLNPKDKHELDKDSYIEIIANNFVMHEKTKATSPRPSVLDHFDETATNVKAFLKSNESILKESIKYVVDNAHLFEIQGMANPTIIDILDERAPEKDVFSPDESLDKDDIWESWSVDEDDIPSINVNDQILAMHQSPKIQIRNNVSPDKFKDFLKEEIQKEEMDLLKNSVKEIVPSSAKFTDSGRITSSPKTERKPLPDFTPSSSNSAPSTPDINRKKSDSVSSAYSSPNISPSRSDSISSSKSKSGFFGLIKKIFTDKSPSLHRNHESFSSSQSSPTIRLSSGESESEERLSNSSTRDKIDGYGSEPEKEHLTSSSKDDKGKEREVTHTRKRSNTGDTTSFADRVTASRTSSSAHETSHEENDESPRKPTNRGQNNNGKSV
ncbi:MAG: hypothetical protein K0R98_82 [Rickettsiaceae bacterium]|jgi:hypothetical protein|nr:hypothetical protein [Rickettsiaceae bacterium]